MSGGHLAAMTAASSVLPSVSAGEGTTRLQTEFLAHITHELRTPVHAIIGYADLLTDGTYGPLNDDQRTTLGYLRQTADDLLTLINNLLDVSRIEAGRCDLMLETFDLRELLAEVCHQLRPLVEAKQLELRAPVELPNPTLRTDRGKLKQILVNLIGNAIKFTERGHVTVRATPCEGGEVGFYTTQPHVAISVHDTGCGIPPTQLHRLFEKFYRGADGTHRRQEGTGLGLFITKHLVELLGGKIEIVSQPGQGSTFTVTIPANYEEAAAIRRLQAHVEQATTASAQNGPRLVLVLTPNPSIALLLRDALGGARYTVRVLPATADVLAEARTSKPTVILLDAEGGPAECWTAFHALKAHADTRDIPTIFLGPGQSDRLGPSVPVATSLNREDLLRQVRAVTDTGRKRILVADDDPVFREVLRCALSGEGYQLDEATDGAEVIAKLDTARPDLLLLDLRMPNVDGWAVLRHIAARPELQDCQVLIVTGDALGPDESATLRAQTAGIISKAEFKVQTVLHRVATTLEVSAHAETSAH